MGSKAYVEEVKEIKNVDKTIDSLCIWIQEELKSDSGIEKSVLVEMVNALANLIAFRYQPEQLNYKPKDVLQKFADLTYSVHVFDRSGKRLVDVDQTGVHYYSEDLLISVCKETGTKWKRASMVYASNGLIELLKKAKPNGSA